MVTGLNTLFFFFSTICETFFYVEFFFRWTFTSRQQKKPKTFENFQISFQILIFTFRYRYLVRYIVIFIFISNIAQPQFKSQSFFLFLLFVNQFIKSFYQNLFCIQHTSIVDWCAEFRILCPRRRRFESQFNQLFGLDEGQWCDSVSSARVNPALNGYLEKSGEGKQEGCAKAQDGWPPAPHCTSWLKGQETEISTAGRDCKVQCCIIYHFTLLLYFEEGIGLEFFVLKSFL